MRALGLFIVLSALAVLATGAAATDVVFRLDPGATEVTTASVRGTFNDWGETPMVKQADGTWSVTVPLEPGEIQYKYFVNGQWPSDMETWLDGGPVDADAHSYADDGYSGKNAVRVVGEGGPAAAAVELPPAPALAEGFARIHYHRIKGDYTGWGLHAWEDVASPTQWSSPLQPTGRDPYGAFWDVRLKDGAKRVGLIVHKGDTKDPGPDMALDIEAQGREVWLITGRTDMYKSAPDVSLLALGDLTRMRAHWVTRGVIAWRVKNVEGNTYHLHAAPEGGLALTATGVTGGESIALTYDPAGLPPAVAAAFPHLKGCAALTLSEADVTRAAELLKGQVVVSVTGADGKLLDATGLQIPGVLDDLFAYDGPLGVTWEADVPTVSVWAPTAKSVKLHLFDYSSSKQAGEVVPMVEQGGIWSVTGAPGWKGKFYLYEVTVYFPATGRVEVNLVTDPYSRSLSTNSERSQIIDLDFGPLKPEGVGLDGEARARRARGHRPLRASHPRLQRERPERSREVQGRLPGLHARLERDAAPPRAGRGGPHARPSPPDVRHRDHQRGPVHVAGPRRPHGVRAELRGAAGRDREDPRLRRLQLGLRPVPLRRARGELRARPGRRAPHHRVSRDGVGALRHGAPRRHGRRVQPHERERARPQVRVRQDRARLLPPSERRRRSSRRARAARTPPPSTP